MDINKLTAKFMSNRKFAEKLDGSELETSHKAFLREAEFYKERTIELTNVLLTERESIEPYLTKDVMNAFNTYMKACISFFKVKDLNDINQKEYIGDCEYECRDVDISTKTEKELEEEALQELDNLCGSCEDVPFQLADSIMMRQIQLRPSTLDKFIKYERIETPIVLPKQREIDLENPELKRKPFFPPPPPPPPNTPYPPSGIFAVEETRMIATSIVEEILSKIVDTLQIRPPVDLPVAVVTVKQEPMNTLPLPSPPKKASKRKKKATKNIESVHIDI
jgi:hypothetical protein